MANKNPGESVFARDDKGQGPSSRKTVGCGNGCGVFASLSSTLVIFSQVPTVRPKFKLLATHPPDKPAQDCLFGSGDW